MKKIYFTLFAMIIMSLLLFSLYFVDIPSPSKLIEEEFQLSIK